MNYRFLTIGLALLLAAIITLAPVQAAQAMTAEQYFADGNRLFRDDLYWAALLRYGQARDEGMDTPLLHYNMGVAHYRAGQYIQAREALQKAATDPTLAVAAQYNLGLNAWALDQTDEALRWFRLVRDQQTNPKLQAYAIVAISRIRDAEAKPDEYQVLVAEREEKRNFTNLDFRSTLGYGTDDNVYRSPADPYIDYADPALPIVVPDVQSGAFIPVALAAKYTVNSLPFEGFFGFYRFAGRYYLDTNLENGNEQFQEMGLIL
jgi:tetratricopeptide (TPR) repeat protein